MVDYSVSVPLYTPHACLSLLRYTMCTAISFMLFGGNSDLFGRRWFVISGNIFVFAGYIAIGSAKNTESIIGGNTAIGIVRLV